MSTVTVGDEFEEKRTVSILNPFLGVFDSLVDSDNVHTVCLWKVSASS